jgi:hypothetical protein
MSTDYTTGARPHHCGAYIEAHIYHEGRFICPTEIDYPDHERRSL